jgi:hypothetical protein
MKHKLEADLRICGIKVDESYCGHFVSVGKCYRLKNCILVKYRVAVESDSEAVDHQHINRVFFEEIDLFLQSLSLLLVGPSQLISHKTRLDDTEFKLKLPTRKVPLGLYNLVALWSQRPKDEIQRYSSLVHKDCWPLLECLISEFRKKPTQTKKNLALALRWFRKGSDEMASLDRLVAYWIAFNSLYEDPNIKEEQAAIKSYIQKNADPSLAQRFIANHEQTLLCLSSTQIELGRGTKKRTISQELADLLKVAARDYIAILKTMMLTIYAIRNNLFHGAYDPDSGRTLEIIEWAEFLLARLLRELIAKQMLGYPLPCTEPVTQEEISY